MALGPVTTSIPKEKLRRLAGELLDLAGDQFSYHGCNDLKRPDYFTHAEWLALETEYQLWNSGGKDSAHGNMGDSTAMHWLARLAEAGLL